MDNNFSKFDIKMSQRALDLAAKGVGQVSPSPLVGCVIVSSQGDIVGEGFYKYQDVTHAEVLALNQAGERAEGGTAYVSLEPHSHQGRTRPCTDALINAGIKKVVCPIEDPNPLVSGKGFAKLREQGIEVITGILKKDAERLNEKFIHWHQTGRPFVHLKMAISLDGRISLNKKVSTPISGKESLEMVHNLRYENDAILVGGNTAVIDNPSLTDRSGKNRNHQLVRIILDNSLQIADSSNLVNSTHISPTIIFSKSENTKKIELLRAKGVDLISTDSRNLINVLNILGERDIQGVLVEGGAEIAGSFVDKKLVDKFTFLIAPIIIGGEEAPSPIGGLGVNQLTKSTKLEDLKIKRLGSDIEITCYPKRNA